jgi:type IV secretion system protein TrbL
MAVSSQTANDLMTVFSGTITAGFSSLAGPVNGIFGLMIGLVVALTGLQWAVSSNRDVLAGAFSKILVIGAFAYIINDWQGLSETIFAGFMQIGLTAGGGSISAADFLNPGAVIETGWEIVKAIGEAPTVTENPLDVIGNLVDAILIGVSMLGIMIAFSVLALQIIVTLLEFKIVTLGGFILLPFGIFSKTSFMAERPLGYVVAAGLKVLALAIVVSGAQTIFAQLMPSPEPDIYEALTILTAAIILAMLSLFAPNLAAALVSGGPTLGAGALSVGGLAVGAAGGAAIAGTMAAGAEGAGAASQIATSARAAAGAAAGKPPGLGPSTGPSGGSNPSGTPPSSPSSASSPSPRSPSFQPSAIGTGSSATDGRSPTGNSGIQPEISSFGGKNSGQEALGPDNGAETYPKRGNNGGDNSESYPKRDEGLSPSSENTNGLYPKSDKEDAESSQSSRLPSAAIASTSGDSPSASGRYHRFPAYEARTSKARAFNAFFAANTARQLLPANENSGSLSPSIREED